LLFIIGHFKKFSKHKSNKQSWRCPSQNSVVYSTGKTPNPVKQNWSRASAINLKYLVINPLKKIKETNTYIKTTCQCDRITSNYQVSNPEK
jgi:hypothetical protein